MNETARGKQIAADVFQQATGKPLPVTTPEVPPTLLDLLDAFERNWGDDLWELMRLDLLSIVAAAKREEDEERGRAVAKISDEAFRAEV